MIKAKKRTKEVVKAVKKPAHPFSVRVRVTDLINGVTIEKNKRFEGSVKKDKAIDEVAEEVVKSL